MTSFKSAMDTSITNAILELLASTNNYIESLTLLVENTERHIDSSKLQLDRVTGMNCLLAILSEESYRLREYGNDCVNSILDVVDRELEYSHQQICHLNLILREQYQAGVSIESEEEEKDKGEDWTTVLATFEIFDLELQHGF